MAVVPAKAGTHNHRLWNMGPRFRGDDSVVPWRQSAGFRIDNAMTSRIAYSAARLRASAARADEPGSGRVSGARTLEESPRWPLASLASAAAAWS